MRLDCRKARGKVHWIGLDPAKEDRTVSNSSVKAEALRLVERLPDDATWEDLQYEIYVRQAIAAGLKDSREGRTVPLAEARRRFGLGEP